MDEKEGAHRDNPFAFATTPSKEHVVDTENVPAAPVEETPVVDDNTVAPEKETVDKNDEE